MGLFPLPVIELPSKPRSHSCRVVHRYHHSLNITMLANSCIYSLNSLNRSFCKYPSPSSHSSQFQARNISSPSQSQSRLLAHIYGCATRYVSRRGIVSSNTVPVSDDFVNHQSSFLILRYNLLLFLYCRTCSYLRPSVLPAFSTYYLLTSPLNIPHLNRCFVLHMK